MIGVVASGSHERSRIVQSIDRAGEHAKAGEATDFTTSTPRLLVAHTEPAVIDILHAGITVPIVPLDTGPGLPSFSLETFDDAIRRIITDDIKTQSVPVLSVQHDGTTVGRALFDAMLITLEPTTISEYQVTTSSTTERFRADGVIIATPIGSHGYARTATGPRIERGMEAVVAVPIAEFSLQTDRWVFPLVEPIELVCVRDETPVGLQLDGRAVLSIPADEPITVASTTQYPIVTPD